MLLVHILCVLNTLYEVFLFNYNNLCFLYFCRSICDRFNVGRATALRAVRRVTRALFKVAHQFISWPSNEQAQTIMHKFEENSRFPNVIGAIDGTHIRIEAPTQNAMDYINRKGYHSIQLRIFKTVKVFIIVILAILYYIIITHCLIFNFLL